MLKVGLTGGIATGKSYTLSLLRSLGCQVIDADEIARIVVEPGQPAHQELVQSFGPEVLTEKGTLDRAGVASIVFNNAAARQRLNAIVHPRIKEEIAKRLIEFERMDPHGMAVVDGALIIETGMHPLFDALIVVYCDEDEQLRRLIRRDGLSREAALSRIQAQMPSSEKRRYADFEINTSGTFNHTRQQVEKIHQTLCHRAQAKKC